MFGFLQAFREDETFHSRKLTLHLKAYVKNYNKIAPATEIN